MLLLIHRVGDIMRMDRYEENNNQVDNKATRTNKNQELYTDVYLNNVYVDLEELKEAMEENDDNLVENVKLSRDIKFVNTSYEEKNYDINLILEEVIKNKKDDNIKRSLDINGSELEIANLIESIEENSKNTKELNDEGDLLSDLLPSDDNTVVLPPVSEPLDINELKKVEKVKEKEENESLLDLEDDSSDDSFLEDEKSKAKVIIPIIIILVIAGIIVGVLFYKDII